MKWLSFLLNRKIVIVLMVVLMLLVGFFTMNRLNVEMLPNATFDQAAVYIAAGQKSALDIEQNIVTPLEKKVEAIKGVESYSSRATLGSAWIFVSFEEGEGDEAYSELELAMKNMESQLSEVDVIQTYRSQITHPYALFIDIYDGNQEEMTELAEEIIKPRLEALPEVRDVQLSGIVKHELLIELDRKKLEEHGLQPGTIMQILQQENQNLALGELKQEESQPKLRWNTTFTRIEDLQALSIPTPLGIIQLRDIASIEKRVIEGTNEAWKNGKRNFINVQIAPKADVTETAMTAAVRKEMQAIKDEGLIPNGIQVEELMAKADFIQNAVENVKSNIYIGGLLAFIVVLLFLRNLRATIIIGISIPLSLLLTFITMGMIGYSFNLVTLIALGLGIGMMVDASIVIFESIYNKRLLGLSKTDSAIQGVKEVAGAVIASMLTTVVVFLPVGIISDPFLGVIIKMLSVVIVITLVTSVIISFTVIPVLSDVLLKVKVEKSRTEGRVLRRYGHLVQWIAQRKWRRWVVVGLFVAIFAGSTTLLNKIPTGVIPDVYHRQTEVVVYLEPGTTPADREKIVAELDHILKSIPDVKDYDAFAEDTTIYLPINMTPAEEATLSQQEVNTRILEAFKALKGEFPVRSASLGTDLNGSGSSPIALRVKGPEIEKLREIANDLMQDLQQVQGITTVDQTMSKALVEKEFILHYEEIKEAGLIPSQVREQVSLPFMKQEFGEIALDGSKLPITLQFKQDINSLQDLKEYTIQTPFGPEKLSRFVSFVENENPVEIRRDKGERVVTVFADKDETDIGSIGREVDKILNSYDLPKGYSISYGGQLQQQKETGTEMIYILLTAVFLVYMVMAVQFNSLIHPLVVMSVVPMTIVGALVGLFLTQRELNLMSGIGIVMLIGIILNNAILLLDRTKQLRAEGLGLQEALVEACKSRIRPIFMTTLTTAFGMLPLALATGSTASFQTPMATAVIFGLLFATLITLVLVPAVYLIVEDILGWPRRFWKRRKKEGTEQAEAA